MPKQETKSTKNTVKKPTKKSASKAKVAKTAKTAPAKSTKKVVAKISTPKEKTTKTISAPARDNHRRKSSDSTAIIILLSITTVFSIASLGFSIYNFLGGKSLNVNFGADGNSAAFTEGTIADIANKVAPSVVSIITQTKTSNNWYGYTYGDTTSASGTGMIISKDGYVLTNKHVVEGATKVEIVLDDGSTYSDVTIIGSDPLNDAAILKINGVSDLKPVTLGDSKTLTIGQQVIAIGNALGQYQNSVTEGIISGVGRSIMASDSSSNYYETLTDMIQTDAQINSGNSGGPLLNAAGEVIGINTALSASGSSGNSISFAIPISSVKGIIKSVIETGKLERAYIGVGYINVTPTVAKSYNLPVDHGAYLSSSDSVFADSPAEKAGLEEDDVIIKVNGVEIGKHGSLSTLIGEYTVGDTVQLTIMRDGKEITKDLTLAAYSKPTKTNIIKQ